MIAADKRIDALARQLKAAGIKGSLDRLRARADVALLLGRSMPGLLPPASGPGAAAGTAAADAPTGPVAGAVTPAAGTISLAAGAVSSATGSINLAMPLSSFLGVSGEPGEMAGFGPVAAADGRALANRLAVGVVPAGA